MPYFSWHGIDAHGHICKGLCGAPSTKELTKTLIEQEISVLLAEKIGHPPFVSRVSLENKIAFFNQLSILLSSGIYLDKALELLHTQNNNLQLKEAIYDIALEINEGNSLSYALAAFESLFSTVMVHMVKAGEESGKLSIGLGNLATYLQEKNQFEQKVRSALMLPIFTFIFFIVVALAIFIFIVPLFVSLFSSNGKQLPAITRIMMSVSSFLSRSKTFFLIFLCMGLLFVIKQMRKSAFFSNYFDKCILSIPFVGPLVQTMSLSSFLQSLALLVQSSVPVVPALKMAQETISNSVTKDRVSCMTKQIEGGEKIYSAMLQTDIFLSEVCAMVCVGEESGALGLMLQKATDLYKQRINKSVALITTFLQPLLMVVMGLLILGLVFAIYLPIFNLSNVIS